MQARDDFSILAVRLGEDAAIRAILEEVCARTGMGFAAVAYVSETRWIASQVVDKIEFGLDPGDELEIKTTICDDIRTCGEAIIIESVIDHPKWRTHHTPRMYGFQSYASLPVYLDDGSFFGTLCAIDPAPRPIGGQAVFAALQGFAAQVGHLLSARAQSIETAAATN